MDLLYSQILHPATEEEASGITRLVKQLLNGKEHEVSTNDINLTTATGFVMIVRDTEKNVIVGTASLFFLNTILGRVGFVEHLVVDEAYRRMGIGTRLIKTLFGIARDNGCVVAEWTSGDYREAARAFYATLGAESRQQRKYTKVL